MNRLKYETSPYLLQHAKNPVDWMPWGDEAFSLASRKDRPIFLSIGYSTCHWCHVMEKESFEDKDVAELLNNTFICIKVDREERPDIDKLYMDIAQMITGRGGWPLTVFMTPDKQPFFTATYIPKKDRLGQIGLLTLLPRIDTLWKDKREEITASASTIIKKLSSIKEGPQKKTLEYNTIDEAFKGLSKIYDRQFGGFGDSTKFPSTHNLSFLLHYWKKTKNPEALEMVINTLDRMRYGGLWDHIGYGFHRYSTDRQWKVPHFEKMLYDQALIAITYLDAYQATGKILYRETVEQIFEYILKNVYSTEGGFYSAEDADSEGVEGKFYLWTKEELENSLDSDESSMICSIFNITDEGNYKDEASGRASGNNILYMSNTFEYLSGTFGMDVQALKNKLKNILDKLSKVREKRIRPFRDDKILTDWNGLIISAFARGGIILGNPGYIAIARKALNFILDRMSKPEGRLYHNYSKGKLSIDANLDDYSFIIMALLELYQATFDYKYIKAADNFNSVLEKSFWDTASGGYYFSPSENKDLIFRQKESYDGAVPSGNSIAMSNLLRLARIKMDVSLDEKARKTAEAFSGTINRNPVAHTQFLIGLDFALGDSYEIIFVKGKDAAMVGKMLEAVNKHYLPNKVIIIPGDNKDIPEFVKNLKSIGGKTTVYVCKNYYCKLPTTSISKMLELLEIEQ